ncbi:MAG: type VI-A CRISPR-associated RNA-guided ribonuclease Cas13a, partial [Lentilitoribacter sp.]
EIKRNESFTRLWRNSVGLSMRSLKGLVDKEEEVQITGRKPLKIENQDLSAPSIAAKAIKHLKHDKFAEQAALMFGKKPIQQEDISRVSFITEGSEIEQKETVWALLRIAGEIRNRTNHFTTRSRLSELFSKSVVSPTPEIEDKKFGSAERGGNKVSVKAADRLTRMMKFDLGLGKQLIVDDLNQLKAAEFLSKDQVNALFSEMSNIKSNSTITTPKYIAMLRKIEALALDSDNELDDPLVPFAKLDLKNLALKGANENQCRIGILRYLYNSGFLNWLEDTQNSSSALKKTIELVAATKKRRSETAQITKDQHYVYSESWLETLADEDKEDIVQFSSKLAAIAVSDGKTVQNYRPQKKEQSSRSKEIEALRQEIFAHLFSTYIQDRNLSWIWTFNLIEDAEGEMVTGENAEIDNFDISPWHAQFYAWLYLIPTDDVAKLRHQFRKTAALEEKSAGDLDDKLKQALAEMDHLMSLYTKVQGAGFDGTEHQNYFGLETSLYENDKLINEDTGEEKTLFDVVFSADNEDHHASIPGTRRGLRQMLRYGHFNALEGIFERHKVSSEEVKKFINLSHADTKALFQDKINLQTSIVEASKDKDFDEDELIAMAEKYQASAIEVHKYNFEINSARLTEFSKLHQLMMHIIGRLTDFTLIWERDRIYSFLGMLF